MKMSLSSILENVAENAKKGSMIAVPVPRKVGAFLQKQFRDISGDEVHPSDMHVTLGLIKGFSGKEKKIAHLLKRFCQEYKPTKIDIQGFGKFPPHESNEFKHVLYANIDKSELEPIRDHLFSFLKKNRIDIHDGGFDEYKPHITIKYCNEEPNISKDMEYGFLANKLLFAAANKKMEIALG